MIVRSANVWMLMVGLALYGSLTRLLHAGDGTERRLVGFVYELSGNWRETQSGSQIQLGQAVYSGTIVECRHVDSSAHIAIGMLDGGPDVRRQCEVVGACARPFPIRTPSHDTSLVEGLLKGFSHRSPNYVTTQTRGGETEGYEHNQVLEIRDGMVDLGSVLTFPAGTYSVEFLANSSPSPVLSSPEVAWGPKHSVVKVIAPGPGLYKIRGTSQSDGEGISGEAWALIATSTEFPERSKNLAAITKVTDRWATSPSGRTVAEAVRRMVLESMAESRE